MTTRPAQAWHLPMPNHVNHQPRRSFSAEDFAQPTSTKQTFQRPPQSRIQITDYSGNANSSASSASTSIVTPFSGQVQLPEINCSPTLAFNFAFDDSLPILPKSRAYSPPRFKRPSSSHGGIGSVSADTVRQPAARQQPVASSSKNTTPISRKKGSTSSGGLLSDSSVSGRSAQKIDFKRLMSKPAAGPYPAGPFSDSELEDKSLPPPAKHSPDSRTSPLRSRAPSNASRRKSPQVEPWMRERTLPLPPQTTRSHAQAPSASRPQSPGRALEMDSKEERRSRQIPKRRASTSTPVPDSPNLQTERTRPHSSRRGSPLPPPSPSQPPVHLTPASALIYEYREKERLRASGGSGSGSGSGGDGAAPSRSPSGPSSNLFDSSKWGAKVVAIGEPWDDAYATWALAEERLHNSHNPAPSSPHSSSATKPTPSVSALQNLSRKFSKFPPKSLTPSKPHEKNAHSDTSDPSSPAFQWPPGVSSSPASAASQTFHNSSHERSRESRERTTERDRRRSNHSQDTSMPQRRERSATIAAPSNTRHSFNLSPASPLVVEREAFSMDLPAPPQPSLAAMCAQSAYSSSGRLDLQEEWERERERKVSTPSLASHSFKGRSKSLRGKSPGPSRSATPGPREEEQVEGTGAKIWKLVRKLSTGALRDRAPRPQADEAPPPLPPLPALPKMDTSDESLARDRRPVDSTKKARDSRDAPRERMRTLSSKSSEFQRNKEAISPATTDVPDMDRLARLAALRTSTDADGNTRTSSPLPASRQTLPARPKTSSAGGSRPPLSQLLNSVPRRTATSASTESPVHTLSPVVPSEPPPHTTTSGHRRAARSSTSSLGEILPAKERTLGDFIIPPGELYRDPSSFATNMSSSLHPAKLLSEELFASPSHSPTGPSLPIPPRRGAPNHRTISEPDHTSIPSSPSSPGSRTQSYGGLPPRFRRNFSTPSPSESPTIPRFSTHDTITIAPLSRRATTVRAEAHPPSPSSPSIPTHSQDGERHRRTASSTTESAGPAPPEIPPRSSARRPPPAKINIDSSPAAKTPSAPAVVVLNISDSEGEDSRHERRGRHIGEDASRQASLAARNSRISPRSRSRSRSRQRTNSLTPPMPFTSSAFAFREMGANDSATPPSGGMTEKEKESKWEDLLARSERAGGTIQASIPGFTGLLSDELEMDLNSPTSDDGY